MSHPCPHIVHSCDEHGPSFDLFSSMRFLVKILHIWINDEVEASVACSRYIWHNNPPSCLRSVVLSATADRWTANMISSGQLPTQDEVGRQVCGSEEARLGGSGLSHECGGEMILNGVYSFVVGRILLIIVTCAQQ